MKFVLDSLNNLAYVDDGQISVLICRKFYVCGKEDTARTEIKFKSLSRKSTANSDLVASDEVVKAKKKKKKKEKEKAENISKKEAPVIASIDSVIAPVQIFACSS